MSPVRTGRPANRPPHLTVRGRARARPSRAVLTDWRLRSKNRPRRGCGWLQPGRSQPHRSELTNLRIV